MAASSHRLVLLAAVAITGCSGAQTGTTVSSQRVRAALEAQMGVAFLRAPQVIDTATLSDVIDVYSARTATARILVVVFDSPAATRQILAGRTDLPGSDVLRRGNVVAFYTPAPNRPHRANGASRLRRALATAFER